VQQLRQHFREVWLIDFEYFGRPGDRPVPVCMVAWELHSNRYLRLWQDQFRRRPPFDTGRDILFVAYYASAEVGCFLALGWPVPVRILDLFTEFRVATNGARVVASNGLLSALTYYGQDGIGAEEKKEMQDLVLTGGPWSREEIHAILEYCQSDVDALRRLLPAMLPRIDLSHALYRARYMAADAAIMRAGVPINTKQFYPLRENWEPVQDHLIARINPDYQVFEGRTFKLNRFEGWLVRNNIPWPRLDSGRLETSDDAFRERSKAFPVVAPLCELKHALSEMRLNKLAVGSDDRNRCMLSAFGAVTGRNTPSNTKFIFGPAVWLRFLITPPPGCGLAYIDYSQQEIGIAAALSGDPALLSAYLTGDCYLAFAKHAGAVPQHATKDSHPMERELYKQCMLAVGYGMEAQSLAFRLGVPVVIARQLLEQHKRLYPVFWKWSRNAADHADLHGRQWTVFGWTRWISPDGYNERSHRNFHAQAHGAEMLRLACCLGVEAGIEICAPVHDAVLICSLSERLAHDVRRMRALMADASRIVLDGFILKTGEPDPIYYPNHYRDPRGERMWKEVSDLLWPSRR
jgi:DNA polymerase-1